MGGARIQAKERIEDESFDSSWVRASNKWYTLHNKTHPDDVYTIVRESPLEIVLESKSWKETFEKWGKLTGGKPK